jgi:predicted ester cyclase
MSNRLTEFTKRYAQAWCSQNPESVTAFFAERGSISINNGPPAVGRTAIAKEAQAFMTTFPDMTVTFDKLERSMSDGGRSSSDTVFHWTLTGTNAGPGGSGKRVRISGYELWKIDNGAGGSRATWTGKPERVDEQGGESINNGLIAESKGRFDAADYERQLKASDL